MLHAQLGVQTDLRVVHRHQPEAIGRQPQHRVVHQGVVDEARRLVVGHGVVVEVVGQVDTPQSERETLVEHLGLDPGFAQAELVVAQAGRLGVQKIDGWYFAVGWRAADADQVGIEGGVQRRRRGLQVDVDRRETVQVAIRRRFDAFGLERHLRRRDVAQPQADAFLLNAGQRLFDFFTDRLAPEHAFALIGDGGLRARRRGVVLVAVFVHVDGDFLDDHLRLGLNRVGFNRRQPLIDLAELVSDAVHALGHCGRRRCHRRRSPWCHSFGRGARLQFRQRLAHFAEPLFQHFDPLAQRLAAFARLGRERRCRRGAAGGCATQKQR